MSCPIKHDIKLAFMRIRTKDLSSLQSLAKFDKTLDVLIAKQLRCFCERIHLKMTSARTMNYSKFKLNVKHIVLGCLLKDTMSASREWYCHAMHNGIIWTRLENMFCFACARLCLDKAKLKNMYDFIDASLQPKAHYELRLTSGSTLVSTKMAIYILL